MNELLLPESLSPVEGFERCRRYLETGVRRFPLMQAGLPRERRDDWITLLAWHRLAREIAAGPGGFERRRGLEELAKELDAALEERARSPVGVALSLVVRRHDLPEELLRRPLLEWRRDEALATFETREALLAHARAVAVPEGRLFLRLAGALTPRNEVLCDALAMALQLTLWLENLAGEFEHGRLRIPIDELARGGLDLAALLDGRDHAGLRRVIAAQVVWTRSFYSKGWELCRALGPWRGRRLAFFLRWHAAALGALEAVHFDALRGPPASGWFRIGACACASLVSPSAPRFS